MTIRTSTAVHVAPGLPPGNHRSGIIDTIRAPSAMRLYIWIGRVASRATTANTSTPAATRTSVNTISAPHASGKNSGDRSSTANATTRTARTATIAARMVSGPTHQRRRRSTAPCEAVIVVGKTLETTDKVRTGDGLAGRRVWYVFVR